MASVDLDHDMQTSCASSDTESDTDDSLQEDLALSYTPFSPSAQYEPSMYEKVMQAINHLENCAIAKSDQQDSSTETHVLAQANILIEFLQSFSTCQCYSEPVISVYKRLAHISFIHRLFELRQKYRLTRKTCTSVTTVDVCWVDIALAYVGLASVALASGDFPNEWNTATEDSLSNRRWNNCILAAVQLPGSWTSIPSVITSHSSSPVAKTLALRLLFTVYVTGKHLNHYDPWTYDSIDPTKFAATCLEVLHQRDLGACDTQDATYNIDAQGAVNRSMLISLFAISRQSLETDAQVDLIRPHSLDLLLELIQTVMTYDLHGAIHHVSNPRETLNPALNILMSSLFELNSGDHYDYFIQASPEPSLRILLVLQDGADFLKEHMDRVFSNRPFLVVLSKACWGTCKIMESARDIDSYVPSLCSRILQIFLRLHSSATSEAIIVKEMISRSLIHIDDHVFRTQLKGVLAEMPSLMQHIAENVVSKTKWLLREPRGKTIENDLSLIKVTLNFLAICWHKESELCILRGTASTLLNLVTDLALTSCSEGSIFFYELVSGLWIALSIITIRPELAVHMSTERREMLWDQATQDSRRGLLIAGSFANYIVTTESSYDILRYVEAWDYLSSTFLTITQPDLVEEENLGILVSPSICLGLIELLRTGDLVCEFIKNSPWTISLLDRVQRVLAYEENGNNAYFRTVRHRLTKIGDELCQQLSHLLQDKPVGKQDCTIQPSKYKTKLLYLHSPVYSCLFLIPWTLTYPPPY